MHIANGQAKEEKHSQFRGEGILGDPLRFSPSEGLEPMEETGEEEQVEDKGNTILNWAMRRKKALQPPKPKPIEIRDPSSTSKTLQEVLDQINGKSMAELDTTQRGNVQTLRAISNWTGQG